MAHTVTRKLLDYAIFYFTKGRYFTIYTAISEASHARFSKISRPKKISAKEGDVVLDPFGGSGTTFDVCERFERRWIGMEIESCEAIVERLQSPEMVPHKSEDFVED